MKEMPEAIRWMSVGVTLDGRLDAWVHADEDEKEVWDDSVGEW